jgi:hypothetical protein
MRPTRRRKGNIDTVVNKQDVYLIEVSNSTPLVHTVRQINSVHSVKPYFSSIHFNIIISVTPTSPNWPVPFRISDCNFIYISHLPMLATYSANVIFLDLIILINNEEYKS